MKTLSAPIAAAIAQRAVLPRDFLEITVRNRASGVAVYERYWTDVGNVVASVIDPDTGTTPSYTFTGTVGLVAIDNIPRVASLTVPTLTIRFAAIGVDIDRLVRTYDARQGIVRIWRGYLNRSTRALVAPAEPRFYGFIDGVSLPTGTETSEAYAELTCVSHSQELTRSSTDTRSDASQRLRSATDDFFGAASSIADDQFFWGQVHGKISANLGKSFLLDALK